MFDTLFTFVNQIVTQNIGNMVGVFTSTITPILGACVILYSIYLAYQSLYEPQNLVVMESIKFIGSLAVVTFIALNTSWYLSTIVPSVLGSGDQIAKALLNTTDGGGASSLQSIFDTMIGQFTDIWNGIDIEVFETDTWIDAIFRLLLLFLTILGFVPFLAVAASYLLVAKIMVSFLLIIGPLFIMMSFFPSTRSFFQAWTGQCFNYTLLSIMYPLAFTIFTQVLESTIFAMNLSLSTLLMTVVVFAALILLSVQIPTFCSTLSGGIGISGLVGGVMGGAGALRKGAKPKEKEDQGRKGVGEWAKNLGKGTIKPG